jgi:hypothetical protein
MGEEELARLLVTEFCGVMDEWKFRPWRDGGAPLVTTGDAVARLELPERLREVQAA